MFPGSFHDPLVRHWPLLAKWTSLIRQQRTITLSRCQWSRSGEPQPSLARLVTGLVFGFVLCPVWLHMAHAEAVLANHARMERIDLVHVTAVTTRIGLGPMSLGPAPARLGAA